MEPTPFVRSDRRRNGATLAGSRRLLAAPELTRGAGKLADVLGGIKPEESADIDIDLPLFAEAGERVPILVTTKIANLDTISLLVERNAQPWAASFRIAPPAAPRIQTQLRISRTSDVVVLVKTRDPEKYFFARADVLITSQDGCP